MSDKLDKLYDLLDGDLPAEQESELFSNLAIDQSLREEFKDQMSIRTAVNADKRAFIPSPDSTAALMGKLGFTGAGAGVAASNGSTLLPYLKYLKTFAVVVASATVGYILGTDIFFGSGDPKEDFATASSTPASITDTVTVYKSSPEDINKIVLLEQKISDLLYKLNRTESRLSETRNSLAQLMSSSDDKSEEKIALLEDYISKLENEKQVLIADSEKYRNEWVAAQEESRNLADNLLAAQQQLDELSIADRKRNEDFNLADFTESLPTPPMEYSNFEDNGLSLYVLGSIYDATGQAKVAPAEYPALNNMGIGLSYELYESNGFSLEALGEFRSENFSTTYPIRPEDNTSPNAVQQPNYNTIVIGGRANYDISELLWENASMNTFVDISGGVAFSGDVMALGGTVIRPRVGAEWYVSQGSYLLASYDYGMLIFPHEGYYFDATKNGFSIGLGVDF